MEVADDGGGTFPELTGNRSVMAAADGDAAECV